MSRIDAHHIDGVSETALLTLYQRAAEAQRPDGIINDPMAIGLRDNLECDYRKFGRTHQATALRALAFDQASREYLQRYPRATVVALAEGFQTSFWRIDNGTLTWLSIDFEPVIRLRERLLPTSDRLRQLAQSALDYSWMDQVDSSNGVLITTEGLLQYLGRDAAFDLITACAARFPGGQLIFDSVPRYLSVLSQRRGIRVSKDYAAPPMPFWFTADQYHTVRAIPGVRTVREFAMPRGRGKVLAPVAALLYRWRLFERFRAPNNVVEFGSTMH